MVSRETKGWTGDYCDVLACPSHLALKLGSVTLGSPESNIPTMSAKQGGAQPGEVSSWHALTAGITEQRLEARAKRRPVS